MHGGAADRSGLIHPGDEVVEVNGIDVLGKTPNDVLEILVSYRFRSPSVFGSCVFDNFSITSDCLFGSKTPKEPSHSN
jgi:hypothetical protein